MSTAWKGFGTMLSQLFTPLMNRSVANTELTGNLGNRFATALSESYRFPLKFLGIRPFLHALGSPFGIVYPKFLLLHKSGETSEPLDIPKKIGGRNGIHYPP